MRLTDAQRRFVELAARAPVNGCDGAIVKGQRRRMMAERLAQYGLVRFIGMGVEEDGPTDHEFPVYEATDEGRRVLDGRGTA